MIFTYTFNNGVVFGIDANEVVVENDEEIFVANVINIHLSFITLRFMWPQEEQEE